MASEVEIRLIAKDEASKVLNSFNSTLEDTKSAAEESAMGVGQLTTAVALGNAIWDTAKTAIKTAATSLADFTKSSFEAAAEAEITSVAVEVLAENFGVTDEFLQSVTDTLIESGKSMVDVNEILKTLIVTQLDEQDAIDLVNSSRDVGIVSNKSSADALRTLLEAINTLNPALLKDVQIFTSMTEVNSRLGDELDGVTGKEKALLQQQELLNIIFEQAEGFTGAYSEAQETAGKKLKSLKELSRDLEVAFGSLFLDALAPLIEGMIEGVKAFQEFSNTEEGQAALENLGKAIAESLSPAVDKIIELIANIDWEDAVEGASEWAVKIGILVDALVIAADIFVTIVGGLISINTAVDNTVASFNGIGDAIKFDLEIARSVVQDKVNSIIAAFLSIPEKVRDAFAGLGDIVNQSFNFSAGVGQSIVDSVTGGNTGGVVTANGIMAFANGGVVPGPSVNRDSVPAMLTPGEIVINPARGQGMNVEVNFNNPQVRSEDDLAALVKVVEDTIDRNLQLRNKGT